MNIKFNFIILCSLLFLTACEEKVKPLVVVKPNLALPINCIKLDVLGLDKNYVSTLKGLYSFDETCDFTLSLSYKKDIVCNSTQNIQMKNMGKFPISYLKLKLRKGLETYYSYYVDLYTNVDSDDVIAGFTRLKKDLIEFEGQK